MAQHEAHVAWRRAPTENYLDQRYSRAHAWKFDGGATVPAAASPHNVRPPFTQVENVDPEEALVAAISSCHMLVFLHEAAKAGYVVDSYEDHAVGFMGEFESGKPAVVKAVLKPHVAFSGAKPPTDEALAQLHHRAHEQCFIANSVRTRIVTEGSWTHTA